MQFYYAHFMRPSRNNKNQSVNKNVGDPPT